MHRKASPWARALERALKERAKELDKLREHDLKAKANRPSRPSSS